MTDFELLNRLIEYAAGVLKSQYTHKKGTKNRLSFGAAYDRAVMMAERIEVHAKSDVFPEALFRSKAPNQSPEEWTYQKEVFKAIGSITHPYWDKALGVLNRIWNEKNYSLKWPEIDTPIGELYPPIEYFSSEYPHFGSIEAFFSQVVTRKKVEDPNSLLVLDLPYQPDNELPKPTLTIYSSENVLKYKEGKYALLRTNDKSMVKFGNQMKREGVVLLYIDTIGVYRIEQVGVQVEFTFGAPELLFVHNLGELPAWRLKGKPTDVDGEQLYESYFYPAIPSLNTAIIDFSTNQLSKIINTFPQKWEYVSDCDDCAGEGVTWEGDARHTCGTCHGTGHKNNSSVTSVYQVAAPKKDVIAGEDTAAMVMPPFGYINKDGANDQIQLLISEIETNITRAFAMLNIDVSNSTAKGSDTALGKQIDREELFSFLLQISSELFELMRVSSNAIGWLRYGDSWHKVSIGAPQSFAIRSDADLTEELTSAKNAGIPEVAMQALLREYADTRFNSQEDVQEVFALTFAADRLVSMAQNDITQKIVLGTVAKWESILHDSIAAFISELERTFEPTEEIPSFWQLPTSEQVRLLHDMAKAKAEEVAPPRVQPIDFIENA
jgi:hypothetical protein